jgi:Glycolipid transfer protein (GLTP)
MSHIHTFVVRTAVKAGMYTLPSRETFLKSLGEGGETLIKFC